MCISMVFPGVEIYALRSRETVDRQWGGGWGGGWTWVDGRDKDSQRRGGAVAQKQRRGYEYSFQM